MPLFSPVSAGGVPKATVSATTGSPTTNTNARAGKTIYAFNGSGSITVGTAGTVEVLVVGGGGAASLKSSSGGGGAGGVVLDTSAYLNAATHTVIVGAGGTGEYLDAVATGMGNPSRVANYYALGGGTGGGRFRYSAGDTSTLNQTGFSGGSGGGSVGLVNITGVAGSGTSGQGSSGGGNNAGRAGGGGGGASNAGGSVNTLNSAGGAGGNGLVTNINGNTVLIKEHCGWS
jgi:hypothetical protein